MKLPELKYKVKTDLRGNLQAIAAIFKRRLICKSPYPGDKVIFGLMYFENLVTWVIDVKEFQN